MQPRWWEIRRAQNLKPSTYTCPFCRKLLPSLSEHVLISPEGDRSKRRHAHTACVKRARERGELPTRDEWRRAQRAAKRAGRGERARGGERSDDRAGARKLGQRLRSLFRRGA